MEIEKKIIDGQNNLNVLYQDFVSFKEDISVNINADEAILKIMQTQVSDLEDKGKKIEKDIVQFKTDVTVQWQNTLNRTKEEIFIKLNDTNKSVRNVTNSLNGINIELQYRDEEFRKVKDAVIGRLSNLEKELTGQSINVIKYQNNTDTILAHHEISIQKTLKEIEKILEKYQHTSDGLNLQGEQLLKFQNYTKLSLAEQQTEIDLIHRELEDIQLDVRFKNETLMEIEKKIIDGQNNLTVLYGDVGMLKKDIPREIQNLSEKCQHTSDGLTLQGEQLLKLQNYTNFSLAKQKKEIEMLYKRLETVEAENLELADKINACQKETDEKLAGRDKTMESLKDSDEDIRREVKEGREECEKLKQEIEELKAAYDVPSAK